MEAVVPKAAAEYLRKLRRFIFHRITVVGLLAFAMEEMASGWSANRTLLSNA
jgi:succinate dehydrogenase/fumarate reductase cytochrome b subunit